MKATSDWQRFSHPLGMVRLILLVDWDPIGIFGHAGAMDQYDGYAVDVYDLLRSGASEEELAAHLHRIEVERMGMHGSSPMHLAMVAAKLRQVVKTADAEEVV